MPLHGAAIDVFLQPGEVYFADATTRIRTLLGSCVAITMWHPQRKIGGMCHYLLPACSRGRSDALDGRYADEAIALLLQEIHYANTHPGDYQAKIFGGGNMFARTQPLRRDTAISVPARNIDIARELLAQQGIAIIAEDVGGDGYRQIIFELSSGDVWLRQHNSTMPCVEAP